MSIFDKYRDFHSLVKIKYIIKQYQTGPGEIQNLRLSPTTSLRINPNFVHYIFENYIVFVSGCNLVIYDCQKKAQRFLMRRHNHLKITYLSTGSTLKTNIVRDFSSTDRRIYKRKNRKNKRNFNLFR